MLRLNTTSVVALIVVAATPSLAGAQTPVRASPFRGVFVPAGAVAGDADATSLELNPGQLGFVGGASTAVIVDEWSDDAPRPGRGQAALVAVPLFGSAAGIGFQWLQPSLPGEPSSYRKLTLGWGVRFARGLALGFAWDRLFGGGYDDRGAFTLGAGVRLGPVLALGLAVRDLERPRPYALERKLPREWDAEFAVRPLRDDRLEVGLAGRVSEGADTLFFPRGRVQVRVARGLTALAELDATRWRGAEGATVDPPPIDYRATVGLQVSFGRLAVTGAGVGNWRAAEEGPPPLGPGASVVLRTLPSRTPPLVTTRHIARLELGGLDDERRFLETVVKLRQLADDRAVGAVLLEVRDLDVGLGRLDELRSLVIALRQRKPVIAHLFEARTREYHLAVACDAIALHPAGTLALTGLAQVVTFFKGTLDKLGVNVDAVRIAEYKGAVEPLIFTEQSQPVRENRNALLDAHFARLLADIALGRTKAGLSPQRLPALVDQGLFSPEEARAQRLVDGLADEREIEPLLQKVLGRRWSVRDVGDLDLAMPYWRPARIAVVLVEGPIVEGEPSGFPFATGVAAWSERIIAALDRAREDSSVRAVVLRVNSPGGSAFASDRIARALRRVRETGRPVIVSMGDVAASGGYYVAAPGDEIFASPGTTTGSIGIYSYKVDIAGLMDRIGLGAEVYKRGERADLFSVYRPWSEEDRTVVGRQLEQAYQRFLQVVAAGRSSRGITVSRAHELGRGRVFTGAMARQVSLVDRLGGVSDAIDEAARRTGVPRGPGGLPELIVWPERSENPLRALMGVPGGDAAVRLLAPLLLEGGAGTAARLPYEMRIE